MKYATTRYIKYKHKWNTLQFYGYRLMGGGGGGSKNFSRTYPKKGSEKCFQTNTSKIKVQKMFPNKLQIPVKSHLNVKSRLNHIFSDQYQ
jgi:hypothetical protein